MELKIIDNTTGKITEILSEGNDKIADTWKVRYEDNGNKKLRNVVGLSRMTL